MKKLIILFIALIPFVATCTKDHSSDSYKQIRKIAWNSLTTQEKATVNVDWEQAPVIKTMYDQRIALAVEFNTSLDELLGPITVFVDASSLIVLGHALRD